MSETRQSSYLNTQELNKPTTYSDVQQENQREVTGYGISSQGSVRERALRVDAADPEAAQKEKEYQESVRNPSFLQRLKGMFAREGKVSVEDSQQKLDREVVKRMFIELVQSDLAAMNDEQLIKQINLDKYLRSPATRNLNADQKALFQEAVIEGKQRAIDKLKQKVLGLVEDQILNTSSLAELSGLTYVPSHAELTSGLQYDAVENLLTIAQRDRGIRVDLDTTLTGQVAGTLIDHARKLSRIEQQKAA